MRYELIPLDGTPLARPRFVGMLLTLFAGAALAVLLAPAGARTRGALAVLAAAHAALAVVVLALAIFGLAQWVRRERPWLRVILTSGAARTAKA